MIGRRRPGPLAQMTLALVTMTMSILLLAELLLGVVVDRDADLRAARKQRAESLGVHVALLLQAGDAPGLETLLRDVVRRSPPLRSIGVRHRDGVLFASAGPHPSYWQVDGDVRSPTERLTIPLAAGGESWGAIEVAYAPDTRGLGRRLLDQPLLHLMLFVGAIGSVGYAMYMRRALQHLDPAAAIPERVQHAFDAMAEGLVVVDARARVLLANKAFRAMHPDSDGLRIGQPLSSVSWLAQALPGDVESHPWARAMADKRTTSNDQLVVRAGADGGGERRLVVNCAPITDAGGAVRGCMTTFNDLTELHRANVALERAMDAVRESREELRRKNEKLAELATRDPLTGALNRRALMQAGEAAVQAAQRDGSALGCLMLDIDHFKTINDTFGHRIGDLVIKEVARLLKATVRGADIVGRYGGEEFCVAAPGLDGAALAALGERVRHRVQHEAGVGIAEAPGLRVTVSVGAARCRGPGDTLELMIDRADRALYRAKRGGRNRVAAITTAEAEAAAEAAPPPETTLHAEL